MVILYEVYNNLYVNMTNRCPCACTFCLRQDRDEMNHSGSLWLEREPTVETTISKEDEDLCRKICEELGVTYRIRVWEG